MRYSLAALASGVVVLLAETVTPLASFASNSGVVEFEGEFLEQCSITSDRESRGQMRLNEDLHATTATRGGLGAKFSVNAVGNYGLKVSSVAATRSQSGGPATPVATTELGSHWYAITENQQEAGGLATWAKAYEDSTLVGSQTPVDVSNTVSEDNYLHTKTDITIGGTAQEPVVKTGSYLLSYTLTCDQTN